MKTKPWAVLLIILTTALTTTAQLFFKQGTNNPLFSKLFLLFIFIGLCIYGVGFVFMVLAFRGGEVSVLYPIFSTSYIWVILFSNYMFHEPITQLKILGVCIIILGITFIALGSKQTSAIKYEEAA